MNNRTILATAAVAIAASMLGGAAEAGEYVEGRPPAPLPSFEVCRGIVHISGSSRAGLGGPLKVDVYLSDVMPRGPVNDEDIRVAFEKFLEEKYGQADAAESCSYAYTLEEAQKIRDVGFHEGMEGQNFIDTGWKYVKPGAPPPPPPAHFAVCWANRNTQVKYYSAVFDGTRDDARKWWPAFQAFLKEKYGFDGPTQCIGDSTEADARKYLQNLIAQDGKTRTMAGAPPRIVETGWKY